MTPLLKSTLLATQSDARLLSLARSGVEPAFDALADRYRRPLLRHCRQLCLSQERAEEILRHTLDEARAALRSDSAQCDVAAGDVLPWLQGIAQAAATKAMHSDAHGRQASDRREAAAGAGSAAMPKPDEVLALRGALAALSSTPLRHVVLVRGDQGEMDSEQPFETVNGALRGLLRRGGGRVRDGITALTPPSLLAWALGRSAQAPPSGATQVAELTAGGGAGVAGLAIKGGLAALTAGLAITGSAIVQGDRGGASRHDGGDGVAVGPAIGVATDGQGGREADAGEATAGTGSGRAHLDGDGTRHIVLRGGSHAVMNGGGEATESTGTASPATLAAADLASGASRAASSSSGSSSPSSSSSAGDPAASVAAATGTTAGASPSVSAQASVGSGTSGQVGVQVSLGGSQPSQESGGSTGSGSAGGSSTSQGSEAGVEASLGALGSAGVKASVP